ncbi:hypothetical protein [Devosia sp. RR2S18]|uniref:hypothetical protein n=1 Tax=Devosia rhizosphaerae TaxID=3049774 RepID=UPI0025403871|nr:hypothetical protein [Devosia sp. RR2S18]WIJ23430.1 hypothetical protein QOV41_10040 [Devosia sp. RR2S18]
MGEAKARKAAAERARLQRKLPVNLHTLHGGELSYREESVKVIEEDPELMDHVELIETVMDYIHFFVGRPSKDLDHETIQLLTCRMWNDIAASLGQALRGYYQISAMVQRDIMEVVFLMSMFIREPARIKQWRESDHKTRQTVFAPRKVREFLDTYDGFTEGKRGKNYRMFCEYAAHATWEGFRLMGPANGKPQLGPFYDPTLMKAVIVELAQLAAQAGANAGHWYDTGNDPEAMLTQLRRMEVSMLWLERYFDRPADRRTINELKKAIALTSDQAV